MAKKKEIVEEAIKENISIETLEDVMSSRYATYAKYVIQDRAIPDVRDGLKPVQRRIIYTMYKTGNVFTKPTKKCAHTVGAVMGTYHPHGDTSIYEALARMSQDWKMRVPLIDFQGNNGSIDGDSPAAYRYTESRLAKVANELIRDLEKETVDMQPNFDDSTVEPVVLPSRFPNLLLNGAEGIAVALATEIPPHNLGELIDAVIYRINHKYATCEDLMEFVKGPDFPGGGIIYNSQGLKDIYLTGRGRIEIAAKTEIIEGKTMNQIVISEIPYNVVKKMLAYQIDKIRSSKEISGIIEVRDESAMDDIRIVVDIKKEARTDLILKYLMNKTDLRVSYSANMVAIVNGKPQTITLISYCDAYVAHQIDVVTRKLQFDLNKAKSRLDIVNGLIIATININDVVELIRHSNDKEDAKVKLMNNYSLSKDQAEAIVMMPLYKLTNTDVEVLTNEKTELETSISEIESILKDSSKLNKVIIKDLKCIKDTYDTPRRTQITEKEETAPLDRRDLITKEDVMFAVSHDGYIKRSTIKSYRSSGENAMPGVKDGDVIVGYGTVSTKDYVVCFTNQGNFISLPVHLLTENKWKDEGVHLNTYCTVPASEKIIRVFNFTNIRDDLYVAILTKFGQIKRMPTSLLEIDKRQKLTKCMKLLTNDEVVGVELLTGNSNIMVVTDNGHASLYNENELSVIGLKTGGVKSINGLHKSQAVGLIAFEPEEKSKFVLITDKGHERVLDNNKVTCTQRLGRTTCVMPIFKSSPHTVVAALKVLDKNESMDLNLRFKNNSTSIVSISDFHMDDINKYAKKNLDIGNSDITFASTGDFVNVNQKVKSYPVESKSEVITYSNSAEVMPDDSEEESLIPEIKEEEKIEEIKQTKPVDHQSKDKDDDKGFEQISIFDDLDD